MKNKLILIVCLSAIVTYSFSQSVVSLNPVFTEQNAVIVPGVEGSYSLPEYSLTFSINKAGDNFYFLKFGSETNPSLFEAVFIKINNELFLDMSSIMSDTIGDDYYRNGFIKPHSIFRAFLSDDTLKLYESNYKWFYNYTINLKSPLSFEWIDRGMLLTLKTEDLKAFITEHINEKDLFKDFITLIRNPSTATKTFKSEVDQGHDIQKINSKKCIPEFPLKEGWLGGDGDVSIQLSSDKTLFIFSDTYVGRKTQNNRNEPGMSMISNTVAVETCMPDGKTDVHYFWNNMFSDHPEPVFKSFASRYRFWVNDAFTYKSSLYVLLEKIAPKPRVAPNDIFGFTQLGFTLAKIINPLDQPAKWQIELIPLPGFANPLMGLRSHIIQNNYISFFVVRNDYAHSLVRKSLDLIDDPDKPFEYFARDKSWKAGIKTDDMDTVLYGFRCNTVNYHPDLKLWIMICDIKFMDNKIKIRTSSSLTGPWSDEKTIYECPEVTPGSASYNKSNYCYLARECIQNYDEKKHIMLVTYDINNSDFSLIKSHPEIYTPKVITISLKEYIGN
jgi:hypothetical protein